jgi:hypothetical protein
METDMVKPFLLFNISKTRINVFLGILLQALPVLRYNAAVHRNYPAPIAAQHFRRLSASV